MYKKLKVGLFGFGCVGQGLHEIWKKSASTDIEIAKIVVKDISKERLVDSSLLTIHPQEVLNDPEIKVIVELTDDSDFAFRLLKDALRKRKAFVTANKKMIAEHLEEIYDLQRVFDTPVLYEGAVCGSIPIISSLDRYHSNQIIETISGILNGSTNYILTNIFQNGIEYEVALTEAQNLGFAETDSSLDVGGFDSKYKLAISIAHAFGVFVNPEQILNIGIERISERDVKYAKANDFTIKLMAIAHRIDNQIIAIVAPQFIKSNSLLAEIRSENNAVQVAGGFTGDQMLIGKGAGSLPTGLAVWSDIRDIQAGRKYNYEKVKQNGRVTFGQEALVNVRVSFEGDSALRASDFEHFLGGYRSKGIHVMAGWATLKMLEVWKSDPALSLILEEGQALKVRSRIIAHEQCVI